MNRKWYKVWAVGMIIVVLAMMLVVLPACGGGQTTSKTTSAAQQGPDKILLGSVVALTGAASSFGQGTFGLKAAVDDINKQGGVFVKEYNRKIPVEIKILDDQSDTTQIGTLAQSLILSDKVNFLVCSPMWPQDIAAMADCGREK